MTIIEQLTKLAEIAPDTCRRVGDNSYAVVSPASWVEFWVDEDELFTAYRPDYPDTFIKEQPAMDWLQCALQRVIEARGWDWTLRRESKRVIAHVTSVADWLGTMAANPPAEALLGALIKALEVRE